MDIEYVRARHRVIPEAMRITAQAMGIGLLPNNSHNGGEVGGVFDFHNFGGDSAKVTQVFLAEVQRLYEEGQREDQA